MTTKALVPATGETPAVLNHTEMHAQHQQCYGENALWHDEIALWQQETKRATADIERLTKALAEHEATLQKHAAAIRLYEQEMAKHEHALSEYERGGAGNDLFTFAHTHANEMEKHADQRKLHEAIKRDHHTTMAHWNLLIKGLVKT